MRQPLTRDSSSTVLHALRGTTGLTRRDLVEHTGLSAATVGRAVVRLIDAGAVTETVANSRTGGRPSHLVSLVPDAATVLAVDIADEHTELAVVGWNGDVLSSTTITTPPRSAADRLEHTLDLVQDHHRRCASHHRIHAIGVSVPGPVHDSGLVDFAPSLQWHAVPLADLITSATGTPTTVHNDANLIAVAEYHYGALRHLSSLLVLAVFHGVGAGIVINDQLWNGHSGFSGQIGRMLLDRTALAQVYTDYGGLESQLGSVGIARRAAAAGLTLDPHRETFAALFTPTDPDPAWSRLADEVLDEFTLGLVNACALLDPAGIVLAGRFAPLYDIVAPALRSRLTGRVLHVPELSAQSTPHAGTILGAARAAFDLVGPLNRLIFPR